MSSSSNLLSRKRRDISNDDNDGGLFNSTTKRLRINEEINKVPVKFTTKLAELHLNSFNAEFRSMEQDKREVLETQRRLSAKIVTCLTNIHQENKILKKGIQIQDQKYKDVNLQYSQLECFMNQLIQRIQVLEGHHHNLQNELGRIRHGAESFNPNTFMPPPPPDVF